LNSWQTKKNHIIHTYIKTIRFRMIHIKYNFGEITNSIGTLKKKPPDRKIYNKQTLIG